MRSALAALLLLLPLTAGAGTLKLIAYGGGQVLSLDQFLATISRADRPARQGPERSPIMVSSPDGSGGQRPRLSQKGSLILLQWDGAGPVTVGLPWPIAGEGFSSVWLDHGGEGYSDGDVVYVNEEIAQTQYRLFKEALERHAQDGAPHYKAGSRLRKLQADARNALAAADAAKDALKRAQAFDAALQAVAAANDEMLAEHGEQAARAKPLKSSARFGLTLDGSLLDRLDYYPWIMDQVRASGSNWVRLVFRPNPQDFAYSRLASFNEYDSLIKQLQGAHINIMGCVLDTNQWPADLTPEQYALRVKNLVFHYRDPIKTWEAGLEINGDWLGGYRQPLGLEKVFRITQAALSQIKGIDPGIETVVTLYWWGPTAPDYQHSLFGWLDHFTREGFGSNLDIVGLSLQPNDNPVGLAFEPIFERVHQSLPDQRLMLSSLGFVEGSTLKGYWWLAPGEVEKARKDVILLYTPAACSQRASLCGGFWWQTLDQLIPADHSVTETFHAYERALKRLGR